MDDRTQGPAIDGTLKGPPSPLSRPMSLSAAVHWERYDILELLGEGGMGAVYKARDRRLGRIVALKFILGDDPELVQRFIQEARAQARIEHDHVCKVYEVGEFQGRAFIAMQFMAGHPLATAQRQMSLEEKVTVLATVAEAVHAAHRQGVIHRVLFPQSRNAHQNFPEIQLAVGVLWKVAQCSHRKISGSAVPRSAWPVFGTKRPGGLAPDLLCGKPRP